MFDLFKKVKYVFKDTVHHRPGLSFLIEQSPRKRTVFDNYNRSLHLAFPYVQIIPSFFIADPNTYCVLRVSMTRKPFEPMDQLYRLPLPNIYETVCMGGLFDYTIKSFNPTETESIFNALSRKSEEAIESFWNSRFDFFDSKSWIELSKIDDMAAVDCRCWKEHDDERDERTQGPLEHRYLRKELTDAIDFQSPSEIMCMIKSFEFICTQRNQRNQ